MKKKSIFILASLVVVCALGLVLSQVFDWQVDNSNASGNIAKSNRYSRKTAEAGMSNMQELIRTDNTYKNNMVAAYYVMQSRAQQFDALVDLSNDVAGNIKEFDAVLKAMNDVRPMIDNVCASMAEASTSLNAALGGETVADLAQNTTNAALAYTTLQKQNRLADQFIEITDKYLKNAEGSDELKFVRDQWLDYQQMTAAMNHDKKAAAELADKGYKLSPEQTLNTLSEMPGPAQAFFFTSCLVSNTLDVENNLASAIGAPTLQAIVDEIADNLGNSIDEETIANTVDYETLANTFDFETIANTFDGDFLALGPVVKNAFDSFVAGFGPEMTNEVMQVMQFGSKDLQNSMDLDVTETIAGFIQGAMASQETTHETLNNQIDVK